MTSSAVSRAVPGKRTRSLTGRVVSVGSSVEGDIAVAVNEVVGAFRQLRGSIVRFMSMLDDVAPTPVSAVPSAASAASLEGLLAHLVQQARVVRFGRVRELVSAARSARSVERRKDLIFEDLTPRDVVTLQRVAEQIRQLDARFVSLCVDHVLEHHNMRG
jgi:hypothetical protein